jgi:hypothetical protein
MITVKIIAEEAIFHLDKLPASIRNALKKKYEDIFDQLRAGMKDQIPLKFLDPKLVTSGVEEIGSSVIGFIEAEDKPGVYAIFPTKAKVLRFLSKSGEIVFAPKVLNHPFPKAAQHLNQYLLDSKPWIVEQLTNAVKDA